jgi:hypothetical protein
MKRLMCSQGVEEELKRTKFLQTQTAGQAGACLPLQQLFQRQLCLVLQPRQLLGSLLFHVAPLSGGRRILQSGAACGVCSQASCTH